MSVSILPFDSEPNNYTVAVDLEGAQYNFELQYNVREGCWTFDLYTADSVLIVAGRRIVVGIPLLNNLIMPERPPGMMIAIDTTNKDLDPGLNDLGSRVLVMYITSDEFVDV